jgi:hypothetical protein
MNLQDLPNDILEKIYHLKHVSEYKDVLDDIVGIKTNEYDDCISLVTWLESSRCYHDEPNQEIEIWTALRNEGYIDDVDLLTIMNDVYEGHELIQVDDSHFHMHHSNITLKQTLRNNEEFINDAREMHETIRLTNTSV